MHRQTKPTAKSKSKSKSKSREKTKSDKQTKQKKVPEDGSNKEDEEEVEKEEDSEEVEEGGVEIDEEMQPSGTSSELHEAYAQRYQKGVQEGSKGEFSIGTNFSFYLFLYLIFIIITDFSFL